MTNVANIHDHGKQARPVNSRVGQNVRYIMHARGISQVQLALEVGLTQAAVSRRISGATDWTPDEMVDTARILKVSVDTLFTLKLPEVDSNHQPAGFQPRLVSSVVEELFAPFTGHMAKVTRIRQAPVLGHAR